ncbi:MAG TPA: hypothetical protein VHQ96_05530 [Gaiellaceae bacterium]|nr:hypothetical protein [Gaiellaceae bacterium]
MSGERRLVLVVGIGRSGTSLFTGILGQLGFHVPQPEVQADDTNPRGFSEPRWVVDFHSRLMRPRRITVFDSRPAAWEVAAEAAEDEAVVAELRSWLDVQFVGADDVVVKDPRIGWFLPLWQKCADALGAETSFAQMLRHPHQVVRSAGQWYGDWQNDASRAAAWLNITLHVEETTRGARRTFVRYDDLLEDWRREISRAAEALDVPRLAKLDAPDAAAVDGFVDPTLKRSTSTADDLGFPNALESQLENTWELVSGLARPGGDGDAKTRAALDEARAAYDEFYAAAEAIAQSSITAVKPRKGARAKAEPATGASSNGAGGSLRSRAFDLVPRRRNDPARLATSRRVVGRSLVALPIRVALMVPVRYRERVPIPIVRAVAKLSRSLHQ